jgi:hypothetical protein
MMLKIIQLKDVHFLPKLVHQARLVMLMIEDITNCYVVNGKLESSIVKNQNLCIATI